MAAGRPPIKTFGGDAFGINSHRLFYPRAKTPSSQSIIRLPLAPFAPLREKSSFVLFVCSFVVISIFLFWLRLCRAVSVVKKDLDMDSKPRKARLTPIRQRLATCLPRIGGLDSKLGH
jgi:hypothetical protein